MPASDPGLYDYSPIVDRPRLTWPAGARVALWIAPNIEFYELDPVNPARPPWPRGQPDVLGYALPDYGNRVGVWRLFEASTATGCGGASLSTWPSARTRH